MRGPDRSRSSFSGPGESSPVSDVKVLKIFKVSLTSFVFIPEVSGDEKPLAKIFPISIGELFLQFNLFKKLFVFQILIYDELL